MKIEGFSITFEDIITIECNGCKHQTFFGPNGSDEEMLKAAAEHLEQCAKLPQTRPQPKETTTCESPKN
jgi:hypothetical protein